MDYFETVKRAARIVWRHKSLWVLGFLASLSGGGGSPGFNGGGGGTGRGGTTSGAGNPFDSQAFQNALRWITENSAVLIGVVVALCLCLIVLSLIFLVLGEIGEGGLIANVARINADETPGLGDGWRAGAGRARSLVGQRLLLLIPGLVLGLIILAVIGAALLPLLSTLNQAGGEDAVARSVMGALFGSLCVIVPLACVATIYQILTVILSTFGRRAIMLDGKGAIDGLRAGWSVFRANILHSVVFAIVLALVRFVVGIGVVIVALATLAPGFVAMIAGNGSDPSVASIGLLAAGGLVLLIVSVFIGSVLTAFGSATWTMAYQQFKSRMTNSLPPAATPNMPATVS